MVSALRSALLQAKPDRVVALSTIGAQATQPNLLTQLGIMERGFETLPMPIAFLRAAWFMENSSLDVASARDAGVINSFLQPVSYTHLQRETRGNQCPDHDQRGP